MASKVTIHKTATAHQDTEQGHTVYLAVDRDVVQLTCEKIKLTLSHKDWNAVLVLVDEMKLHLAGPD